MGGQQNRPQKREHDLDKFHRISYDFDRISYDFDIV
jgi:hypothetical protein